MIDWQLIETANREDTILAWSPTAGYLVVDWHCGRWDDGEGRPFADDITHWAQLTPPQNGGCTGLAPDEPPAFLRGRRG